MAIAQMSGGGGQQSIQQPSQPRKDMTLYDDGQGGRFVRNDDGSFVVADYNGTAHNDLVINPTTNNDKYQATLGAYNRSQQYNQAKDFRSNIGNYENQLYSGAQSQTYGSIANNRSNIRSNANSRGLLYSGMRQGAEAGAEARGQAGLAAERSNINSQIEGYGNQLDTQATSMGLQDFQNQVQNSMAQYQNQLQQDSQRRQQIGQFIGGAGSIAGLIISDENEKKNIEPADKDLEGFLGHVDSKKYDYKNPSFGKGKHYGFLAQDLEKHPVGKSMVEEHNGIKTVNMAKGLGTILSIQSFLNKKMDSIKGAKS